MGRLERVAFVAVVVLIVAGALNKVAAASPAESVTEEAKQEYWINFGDGFGAVCIVSGSLKVGVLYPCASGMLVPDEEGGVGLWGPVPGYCYIHHTMGLGEARPGDPFWACGPVELEEEMRKEAEEAAGRSP